MAEWDTGFDSQDPRHKQRTRDWLRLQGVYVSDPDAEFLESCDQEDPDGVLLCPECTHPWFLHEPARGCEFERQDITCGCKVARP